VLVVLADYPSAKESCARLSGLTSALVETICTATIDGIVGRGDQAYARLTAAMAVPNLAPDELTWARSVRGEIALYAGRPADAETDLRAALAAEPSDVY